MSRIPDSSSNVESVYALSPMQEGMLFHTLLKPRSGIYLMQNRYRLGGAIDEARFIQAWQQVTERHPMLRTSFAWKTQKRPLQVVQRSVKLPFDIFDLRSQTQSDQEAFIQAELVRELEQGFELTKAPLMRFRLARLGEQSYEFIHSFHHILLDEWCTSLLMTEFISVYTALRDGKTANLPAVRSYRDYIEWLARQDRKAADAFWSDTLQGFTSPTALGLTERHLPEHNGVEDLVSHLDAESTQRLQRLAQQERVTLNTITQAAWAILISRYSGDEDVVFGVTVAGRPAELPGVESIVGLFINTLPLRVRVDGKTRLNTWLQEILQTNLRLRRYEYSPLVDVQNASAVPRGQDLFHSLFVFENAPIDPSLRAGTTFRVQEVQDRVHTNYPLTVMAWPDTELGLKISYDRSRVERKSVEGLLEHLRAVLEAMARNPEARLDELSLLTATERRRTLLEWNPPSQLARPSMGYAELFEAVVATSPQAPAVTYRNERFSYAELNRKANRIAHALLRRGVGPEQRVLVALDRKIEFLVAVIGVFKAGAAYVPVEPSYPDGRIRAIFESSKPRVVLTESTLVTRLQEVISTTSSSTMLLSLSELEREEALETNPVVRRSSAHLAYIIYTSGSTGVPKGAMVEQRGMLNNMLSKGPRLILSARDVIAQTASVCFDISVWQFLTALIYGGVVDIVPDEVVREPVRLRRYLKERGVTIAEVVPGVLQGMLDDEIESEAEHGVGQLRWLLPTGEALPATLARAWLTRHPNVPLMNAYGPAECSDDVSLQPILVPPAADEREIAIGKPVDHLRLYVLDRSLQPLPVAVRGELYVGGLGVGRGYVADPRRTALAFIPDPFATEPGQRLYRTGDLAHYRDDGTLEFAGRRDHQVKVRGFRIELGEIEAHLREHADMEDAVVLARKDRPGAVRLVAYVVSKAQAKTPRQTRDTSLREWLTTRLPDYMVPALFIELDVFPRTPNGKIDRKALPATEAAEPRFVAPRTATEEILAGIWAQVLELDRVSVLDSFYALGGHSLLLTQVLSRIRRSFNVELSLETVFAATTIEAQARAVLDAKRGGAARMLPEITRNPSRDERPLSFAQERFWFLSEFEPDASAYHVPLAVWVRGPVDGERLERALNGIVQRHEALRTRFSASGGTPRTTILTEQHIILERTDIRQRLGTSGDSVAREAEIRRNVELRARTAFDLGKGPLLRGSLIHTADNEHMLVLVLHHIVSDGWSLNVLIEELCALYAGKKLTELAELPVQYADYAEWQRQHVSTLFDEQLVYWRAQLDAAAAPLALATDYERPEERSDRGARWPFIVSVELTKRVREVARTRGATPFIVLLAAFKALLARRTGQSDIAIGTPSAGRTRFEIEPLIGLFANTLVLRSDLSADPTFATIIEHVRSAVFAAQAHQDLPFEKLVQALRPQRDLSRTPLFQVMFSLQENRRLLLRLDDLELVPLEVDTGTAQFDLSLHMTLDGEELGGSFEYSTDLFERETVAELGHDFLALLKSGLATPNEVLSALSLPERAPKQPKPRRESSKLVEVLANPNPDNEGVATRLAQIWATVLQRESVNRDDNFFELGGDSILSLQVVSRARQAGLHITARHMFQCRTLSDLARAAASLAPQAGGEGDGLLQGAAKLLPIQQRFFERGYPNPHHWNQALLVKIEGEVDRTALSAAADALLAQHDALRSRFIHDGNAWRQEFSGEARAEVHWVDLSRTADHDFAADVERQASRWQASLDISAGPLFRLVVFALGAGRGTRLLLVAHHLVVDGVSFRILLDDLENAYLQAAAGSEIILAPKSLAAKHWVERLDHAAQDPLFVREAEQWLALPWDQVTPLSVDRPHGDRAERYMESAIASLSAAETTALIEQAPHAYRATVEEILLAGLAQALTRWSGREAMAIDIEGHGREELEGLESDLSRTVGWLTTVFPLILGTRNEESHKELVQRTRDALRALPRRGLPFSVVREFAAEHAAPLRALPAPQIAFNYLGQWDVSIGKGARFALASESSGLEHDPHSPLPYEIEIDAAVYGGRFEASFRYSSERFQAQTLERLASNFQDILQELLRSSNELDATSYAPSDFPDVELQADELAAILGQLD